MTSIALSPLFQNDALAAFIRSAALLSGADSEDIEGLCARMGLPHEPDRWRSTLNNDGTPIQLCLGLRPGASRPAVRVIADSHIGGKDGAARAARSRRILARLARWHAPDMTSLCHSALDHMTPSGCGIPYWRDGGDAWLAAGTDGRGVAIYATARWGDPASRWPRALAWLLEASPDAGDMVAALAKLAMHSSLVSVGIEGSTAGNARAKFYWRPNGSAPLFDLGVPLLAHEALPAFLADATEGMATPASAIVGSVGVSLATGALADVKLDLCGHCVPRGRADWARRIDRYAERHGMATLPFAALDPEAPVEIAFVGLGINDDFQPRLNVYLKPVMPGGQG